MSDAPSDITCSGEVEQGKGASEVTRTGWVTGTCFRAGETTGRQKSLQYRIEDSAMGLKILHSLRVRGGGLRRRSLPQSLPPIYWIRAKYLSISASSRIRLSPNDSLNSLTRTSGVNCRATAGEAIFCRNFAYSRGRVSINQNESPQA